MKEISWKGSKLREGGKLLLWKISLTMLTNKPDFLHDVFNYKIFMLLLIARLNFGINNDCVYVRRKVLQRLNSLPTRTYIHADKKKIPKSTDFSIRFFLNIFFLNKYFSRFKAFSMSKQK